MKTNGMQVLGRFDKFVMNYVFNESAGTSANTYG